MLARVLQRSGKNDICSMRPSGFICSTVLVFSAGLGTLRAQPSVAQRIQYIEEHAPLAVEEMRLYGIPASITLAQGILESADGKSKLAREGKNHFGIKCHQGWSGPSIMLHDDRPDECFRVYGSVQESFRDHSLFLKTRSRYAELFSLPPDDYRAWAVGLKKAGYATAPDYAERLIRLIEQNDLDQYDRQAAAAASSLARRDRKKAALASGVMQNGLPVYYAQKGQTWDEISRETGLSTSSLLKKNDALTYTPVVAGMPIYLKAKKARAPKDLPYHTAVSGDTPWTIAQRYGIRVNSLYALNNWEAGEQPNPGDRVVLR